ncbi:MAG: 3-oxoacyl-ACP reductase FabG [Firmicutes bacterium]|nr:3-oxoacyl-ACP reductase FabG [Bacillota bacterium]
MLAFVSGASRGIGAACAEELAGNGFDIVINYRSSDAEASEVAAKVEALGRKAYLKRFDISDAAAAEKACAEVLSKCGPVDVLVNNAGISISGLVQDMSSDQWDALLSVNLKGMFDLCKGFVPSMVSRKKGCIINISSMWGQTGASFESVYSASKGGVDAFTKALAKELGPSGIRVNAVSPGCILTDMCACYSEQDLKALAEETALGRNGTPQDIANAVVFLASDKASFITGQILGVNGGMVI